MGNRRVNGVLGDIATRAQVIMTVMIFWQCTALQFHFVRRLPSSRDDLTDSPHRLRIRGNHAEGAEVMQNVLSSNGFFANTRVCERDIFWY